jgi:2-aminoadipate transaminase
MLKTALTMPGMTAPIIPLTRGVPADESYPLAQLQACASAVLGGKHALAAMRYGDGYGFLPLRQWLAGRYGVADDEVMLANGSLQFVEFVALGLLAPGDRVLVESPTYDRTLVLLRRYGLVPVPVALEGDGVNLAALSAAIASHQPKLCYCIPDFQNPAGTVMSLAKRQELLRLAREHQMLVLEDAPYRPLRYRGEALPSLRELAASDPVAAGASVLYMSSYTKQISPGVRLGYMVGPKPLLAKLARVANDTYISGAFVGQAVVHEFCAQGLLEPQLAALRALYAPRLDAMLAALDEHLPGVLYSRPDGGFFVSIRLPAPNTVAELLPKAAAVGLQLTDGRGFFVSAADGDQFLRLPFCALTPAEIANGIERLAGLLKTN